MSDAVDIMNAAHNRTIGYPSAPAQGIACRKCMVQHAHFCQASTYDLTMDEPKDYPLCSPCAQSKPCHLAVCVGLPQFHNAPSEGTVQEFSQDLNHPKPSKRAPRPKEVAKQYGVSLSTVYDIRLEKKMNKIEHTAQDLPPAHEPKCSDVVFVHPDQTAGVAGATTYADPLVFALFQTLPTGTADFDAGQRQRWLKAAEAIFDLIYGAGE